MLSYEATIVKALGKFGTGDTKNPDEKHNVGNMLGEFFLWNIIAKYADAKKEAAYKKITESKLFKQPEKPGNYEVANSPHFALKLMVTQPIKRFSVDELANLMKNGKYKVPEPYTKEKAEEAKVPTTSQVRKEVVEVV